MHSELRIKNGEDEKLLRGNREREIRPTFFEKTL